MDRKAELERKKAKLVALREEKERRRREKELKDMEDAAGRLGGSLGIDKDQRKDLDEMLSSLGVAPVSEVLSSLSSVNSLTSDNSNTQTPDASLQTNMNGPRFESQIDGNYVILTLNFDIYSVGKKSLNLSVYNVQSTNIPPKEILTYSKQTQTNSTGGHERDEIAKNSGMLNQKKCYRLHNVLHLLDGPVLLSIKFLPQASKETLAIIFSHTFERQVTSYRNVEETWTNTHLVEVATRITSRLVLEFYLIVNFETNLIDIVSSKTLIRNLCIHAPANLGNLFPQANK
uniref:Uncharacterized protein n=1 Tax=Glossina austeni TaxID=7395 RepID=A0A1A9VBN1_GLOAU